MEMFGAERSTGKYKLYSKHISNKVDLLHLTKPLFEKKKKMPYILLWQPECEKHVLSLSYGLPQSTHHLHIFLTNTPLPRPDQNHNQTINFLIGGMGLQLLPVSFFTFVE